MTDQDRRWMQAALALARRQLGRVWPNPAVGCVLVRDGRLIAQGVTGDGGRPHGEAVALALAGAAAKGATAYVTLEPCSHYGRTPPCAEALIAAGVARVVIALRDPDKRVNGSGIAALEAAGVIVEEGVEAEAAGEVNEGFIRRVRDGRPLVTLKLAASLDGRIAAHGGDSQWITDATARAWGHGLRASHDALLIGSGTALADDPDLTCRLPGLADGSPVRIVIDSHLAVPLTARLIATARAVPVWVICRADADSARQLALRQAGVEIIEVGAPGRQREGVDLPAALSELGRRGLTRVLVEGGARIAGALVRAGLVDSLVRFTGPILIGGDGLAAVMPFGTDKVNEAPRFECVARQSCASAAMEIWHPVR